MCEDWHKAFPPCHRLLKNLTALWASAQCSLIYVFWMQTENWFHKRRAHCHHYWFIQNHLLIKGSSGSTRLHFPLLLHSVLTTCHVVSSVTQPENISDDITITSVKWPAQLWDHKRLRWQRQERGTSWYVDGLSPGLGTDMDRDACHFSLCRFGLLITIWCHKHVKHLNTFTGWCKIGVRLGCWSLTFFPLSATS